MRRTLGLLLVAALTASALTACAPSAGSGDGGRTAAALGGEFAELGIATIPFGGSDEVYPVDGEPVMVLTDWQLQAIADELPDADAARAGDQSYAMGGIKYYEFSQTTAGLPGTDDADHLDPAAIVGAWWSEGESDRAAKARDLAPDEHAGDLIPTVVLALFVADALDGRQVTPASASGPQAFAAGPGGIADGDACSTIADGIASVNEFLDGMGAVGTAIRGGLEKAYGAIDTASGKLLTAVKQAIAVANLVLNTATLLTGWKQTMAAVPASGWKVNYAPEGIGTDGTVTVTLEGLASPPSPAVQACLKLVGLVNPTSQKGALVTWNVPSVPADNVLPLLLLAPDPMPVEASLLDDQNQAAIVLGTGTETLEAKKRKPVVDATTSVSATIERVDVEKLANWIRSLDNGWVHGILGDTLEAIATAVTLAASLDTTTLHIPVTYWVSDDQPDPVASPAATTPAKPPKPPVDPMYDENCPLRAQTVQATTGFKITKVEYGEFGGGGTPLAACMYYVDGGPGMVVLTDKVPPGDVNKDYEAFVGTGSADGFLKQRGLCGLASDWVDLGNDIYSYLIWDLTGLAGVYYYHLDHEPNPPEQEMLDLARYNYMCIN
jgi:hypothetical protein